MDHTALPGFAPLLRRHLGEARMVLVAWRLLVLQVSHPVVAAGTNEHSTYRAHPWRRIEHTLTSGRRLVHMDRDTLRTEVARLDRAHRRIHGVDRGGRTYSAQDPGTRAWVLITLYESVIALRALSGDPAGPEEQERMYGEFRSVIAEFGVEPGSLPASAADVPAYMDTVIRTRLEFGPEVRHLLYDMLREAPRPHRARLLTPVWPLARRLIAAVLTSLTVADLPPAYRERFRLAPTRAQRLLSRLLHRAARRTAPLLPDRWRYRTLPGTGNGAARGPRHAGPPRPRFSRHDARPPKLDRFFSEVLDQTGDGFIGAPDLRAMAHNVCWQLDLDEEGEARVHAGFDVWWGQLRRTMATDGDGRIDREEFIAATLDACDRDSRHLEDGLQVALRAVFHAADTGRSGFMEVDEYRVLFGARLHPAEVTHGFRQLDRDGDGRITEAEFVGGFTEFFTARNPLAAGSQLLGHP